MKCDSGFFECVYEPKSNPSFLVTESARSLNKASIVSDEKFQHAYEWASKLCKNCIVPAPNIMVSAKTIAEKFKILSKIVKEYMHYELFISKVDD